MSNPHVENAIHTISEANNPNSVWESSDTERIALQIEANTRATLGLAYEQRTANLIAAFREDALDDTGTNCIDFRELANQITERLDLA